MLLTILSSLAQDESRNISENSTWGIRRKFEQGKVQINHKKFLGYDKDQEVNLIINEREAKTVRRIYRNYLDGMGTNRIAKELKDEGVPTWSGNTIWYESTVRKMLTNEKYKGDALLQKTYTVDFLSKKRAENNGEVPQYYVGNNHPGIIDEELWGIVQLETERRKAYRKEHDLIKTDFATVKDNPFSSRIICGSCGSTFGRKTWNSTKQNLKRRVWQCNRKYEVKGEVRCTNKHVDNEVLFNSFISIFNALVENKKHFIAKWKEELKSDNLLRRYRAGEFIKIIEGATTTDEFDTDLYFKMTEKMTVFDGEKIVVSLLDGTEIECEI